MVAFSPDDSTSQQTAFFSNDRPASFSDLLEKYDPDVNFIPQLFNSTWNSPSVEGNEVIFFGDCEKQGTPHDQPITFYCYCLNNGANVYLKLRPDSPHVSDRVARIHGIETNALQHFHSVSVKEGISSLVQWMIEQIGDWSSPNGKKIRFCSSNFNKMEGKEGMGTCLS